MKTRDQLKAIRESRLLDEKLALAKDTVPGTYQDWRRILMDKWNIAFIRHAAKMLIENPETRTIDDLKSADETLRSLATRMARAVYDGNSKPLRELADAINQEPKWKTYTPTNPNPLRVGILDYISMWEPLSNGPMPDRIFNIREIIFHLVGRKIVRKPKNGREWNNLARSIRRICEEDFQLKIHDKRRRPKIKTRTH